MFAGTRYLYFAARIAGGEFGTGLVPDHADPDSLARSGTFEPVWVPLAELANVDVGLDARPRALIEQLVASM